MSRFLNFILLEELELDMSLSEGIPLASEKFKTVVKGAQECLGGLRQSQASLQGSSIPKLHFLRLLEFPYVRGMLSDMDTSSSSSLLSSRNKELRKSSHFKKPNSVKLPAPIRISRRIFKETAAF